MAESVAYNPRRIRKTSRWFFQGYYPCYSTGFYFGGKTFALGSTMTSFAIREWGASVDAATFSQVGGHGSLVKQAAVIGDYLYYIGMQLHGSDDTSYRIKRVQLGTWAETDLGELWNTGSVSAQLLRHATFVCTDGTDLFSVSGRFYYQNTSNQGLSRVHKITTLGSATQLDSRSSGAAQGIGTIGTNVVWAVNENSLFTGDCMAYRVGKSGGSVTQIVKLTKPICADSGGFVRYDSKVWDGNDSTVYSFVTAGVSRSPVPIDGDPPKFLVACRSTGGFWVEHYSGTSLADVGPLCSSGPVGIYDMNSSTTQQRRKYLDKRLVSFGATEFLPNSGIEVI